MYLKQSHLWKTDYQVLIPKTLLKNTTTCVLDSSILVTLCWVTLLHSTLLLPIAQTNLDKANGRFKPKCDLKQKSGSIETRSFSRQNDGKTQFCNEFHFASFFWRHLFITTKEQRKKKQISWKFESDMICKQLIAICNLLRNHFCNWSSRNINSSQASRDPIKKINQGSPDEDKGQT